MKYSYRDAMVASMVKIHRQVKSTTEVHAKRTGKRHFVSPRDYLDFIRHFQKLYDGKRRELEDQQLHLNIGLDKLKQTEEDVDKLRKGLAVKEAELTKKNKEAGEKLQSIVAEQAEAEQQKTVIDLET
jgi:dynein heavy chain 1, cytosolic